MLLCCVRGEPKTDDSMPSASHLLYQKFMAQVVRFVRIASVLYYEIHWKIMSH